MITLGVFSGAEVILMLLILLVTLAIPIIALVDILKSKFEGNNKTVWVLVVLFLGLLGVILYYAIGRKQRIQENQNV